MKCFLSNEYQFRHFVRPRTDNKKEKQDTQLGSARARQRGSGKEQATDNGRQAMSCASVLATHMFQSTRTQRTDTKTVHGMITLTRCQLPVASCCSCSLRKKNFNFRNVFRLFFFSIRSTSDWRVKDEQLKKIVERTTHAGQIRIHMQMQIQIQTQIHL